ncbi:hypothetical protein SUGI_0296170 [Cryptomeria japonica]|nr:hypothetical protein SUGI_0296170 [Cryptomeria japonica]
MAAKQNPRIEGNIWRDCMQYGFELHSCRLGFLFANDRLPQEHRRVAIRVLVLPLLNFRGCGFLSHHLESASPLPHALLSRYFDDGTVVAEAMAMCNYIARGVFYLRKRRENILPGNLQDNARRRNDTNAGL